MEMRWEKLYSGGLCEFHQSESEACRVVRRARIPLAAGIVTLLMVLIAGSVLLF